MRHVYTSTMVVTDLVVGEQGNAVIHSHSANGKIVLHVAGVVVGQVDNQVYVTLADQSRNRTDRNTSQLSDKCDFPSTIPALKRSEAILQDTNV